DGMILLRLIQAHRTVEAIVQKTCLGRFTTNSMLAELWSAGLIEPAAPTEYLNIAREHLRMSRLEEAQRVAELAIELNAPEEKEKARTLLSEIEKARKPTSTGSASVKVSADPKVRSEVIRRAPANLMLKKERSSLPLVIVVILVLAGIGVGVYYRFRPSAQSEYTISRRQLEETSLKAQELIAAEKYEDALQLLREFRTFDADVQKLATELFERRQGDVEAVLQQAIEKFRRFNAGGQGGTSDELQAAALALQRLINTSILNPKVMAERDKARPELEAYFDSQRAVQLEGRLKEVEGAADKGCDAQQQAYEGLLAEDPPESIAGRAREQLDRLQRQRLEAARLLKRAQAMQAAGDMQSAKNDYEELRKILPGSAAASEAEQQLAATARVLAAAQTEYERIEGLVQQNKTAEARAALLEFLKAKPVYPFFFRALSRLQALQPVDEAAPSAALKAAVAFYDRQPPDAAEARKRIVEVVEQYPHTRTALTAALRVDVTSRPDGATISVNGKPSGTTPAKVDVPALGLVCIAFAKEGFRTEELVWSNFREERVAVTLERLSATTARLPVAARGGLLVEAEQLILAGPSPLPGKPPELVFCARQGLKVRKRTKLQDAVPKAGKAPPALPPFASFSGEIFMPAPGSFLLRVNPLSGMVQPFTLGAPATSGPVFFEDRDELGGTGKGQLIGVATQLGYECYQLDNGKVRKRIPLPAADQTAVLGAAFDGEPQGVGAGVVVLRQNGTLELLSMEKKGAAVWSVPLAGEPVLAPFVARDRSTGQGRAIVVGVKTAAPEKEGPAGQPPPPGALVLVSPDDGAVLWRASLPALPVAMAADEERLYVSTDNTGLIVFELK
ncbi:MAG: PEGA domain-containing protein, partial [Planctomycetota bacterium]|nr:PEGA domain-containing protein [Planctomycetota bacterium]